jgi:FkbM family methyltransferase
VYEPVPAFAAGLRARFAGNDRVRIVEAALGGSDGVVELAVAGAGSSTFGAGAARVTAPIADVARFFAEERLEQLAVLKLNIEGGEYEVLERLASTGLLERIRSLLLQFHLVAPDSAARRTALHQALRRTHRLVFDYAFVWERWDRS